jgi:hypothetical protein
MQIKKAPVKKLTTPGAAAVLSATKSRRDKSKIKRSQYKSESMSAKPMRSEGKCETDGRKRRGRGCKRVSQWHAIDLTASLAAWMSNTLERASHTS